MILDKKIFVKKIVKKWKKVFTNVRNISIIKKNYIIPSDNRLLQ